MSTWTKMKVDGLVKFEWANSIKTVVRAVTVEGRKLDVPVADLPLRLANRNLLKAIRSIYEDMKKWADENKEETNAKRISPGI